MKHYGKLGCAAIAAGLALPDPAHAHGGTGLAGGFVSGFIHPLSGPDHLLAMVCVGIWGAFLGRPLLYLLPISFPIMMVVGAIAGMAGMPLPAPQIAIAISVLVLGACIALELRPPVFVAVVIVGAFATFHGYSHGRELPSAAEPVGYSAGFVLATGFLHVIGIALGELKRRYRGILLLRTAGAVVAMAGIAFLTSVGRP